MALREAVIGVDPCLATPSFRSALTWLPCSLLHHKIAPPPMWPSLVHGALIASWFKSVVQLCW